MNNPDRSTRPSPTPLRTLAVVFVAFLLFTTGCASDTAETADDVDPEPTQTPTAEPTSTPTPAPPTPAPTTEDPAEATTASASDTTPAGEVLDWIVTLLNNPDPDPDAVAAKFAPEFLAIVPIEQIMGLLPQLNLEATGPWSIESSQLDTHEATAILRAEGSTSLSVDLVVSATEPHLIEGLLFKPVVETPTVATLDDYESALADIAPISRVGIFEIADGECSTVIDLGADQVMPIGSIFKLWILAELAHQVESGEASWDELMPVQDEYKSSPDGTVFNTDTGTELTLLSYAEEMISISDNSATDHLLQRLGRERVEAAMATSGVADPAANIPFLSATDLFRIKFHPDAPNSTDYRALNADDRRAMLQAFEGTTAPWIADPDSFPPLNAEGVALSQPRDHDLEWFATPADLCRTHAYLAKLAERPGLEPIAEILSINDDAGLPFDRETWTDLRFKGGSEQGIAAVAWRLQRSDGRVFVLAGGVENPDAPVNAATAAGVLQRGAKLVADFE